MGGGRGGDGTGKGTWGFKPPLSVPLIPLPALFLIPKYCTMLHNFPYFSQSSAPLNEIYSWWMLFDDIGIYEVL